MHNYSQQASGGNADPELGAQIGSNLTLKWALSLLAELNPPPSKTVPFIQYNWCRTQFQEVTSDKRGLQETTCTKNFCSLQVKAVLASCSGLLHTLDTWQLLRDHDCQDGQL